LGSANLFIQYTNLKFLAASYAGEYETASTIITSNKAFPDWMELSHDPIIVTAILDRLLHHSVVINIKGNSYRLKDKVKEKELN
jgi:DNA replication protein DnaC